MLGLIIPIFSLLLLIFLFVMALTIYNGIIALQHRVDKAWYNIDSLLQQRHDEIPNLVSVCKAYMVYEERLLNELVQARAAYQSALIRNDKMKWEEVIRIDMEEVFARAENHPELMANKLYDYTHQRLIRLEDEIADARVLYNDYVTNYNKRIQRFPDLIIAEITGVEKGVYFRIRGSSQLIQNVSCWE